MNLYTVESMALFFITQRLKEEMVMFNIFWDEKGQMKTLLDMSSQETLTLMVLSASHKKEMVKLLTIYHYYQKKNNMLVSKGESLKRLLSFVLTRSIGKKELHLQRGSLDFIQGKKIPFAAKISTHEVENYSRSI